MSKEPPTVDASISGSLQLNTKAGIMLSLDALGKSDLSPGSILFL